MDLNYFICTLGQASRLKTQPTPFSNIPTFLEQQARDYANLPAVGFYNPNASWKTEVLTFQQVLNGTRIFASKLSQNVEIPPKQTVALLCPSSANFLFTWLGLMRLGHPVLLIAPQCSAKAVVELCKQCECSTIVYDGIYSELATASRGEAETIQLVTLPFKDEEIFDAIAQPIKDSPKSEDVSLHDVAYLHHTSGTSSGIPKPIPQTHNSGVGVYYPFDGSSQATFTTTPLYHGGIADLFRAWTSHALIWLFPGKDVPITAGNVNKCLEAAETAGPSRVEFLSCVPYVLEMLSEDPTGLQHLQKMTLVGVGGAALPASVGDKLVQQGVNLVSRFGGAECGFLLASNRDFAKDKEWQYLRVDAQEDKLRFESREDGLSELVILDGWPHMSKRNRDDGSFATSDLFQPHSEIRGAWKYHSRADAQLTLVTGKKFDPSPLEAAITASTALLSDVLVFGNGKPYPGALLFRSEEAKAMDEEEVLKVVGENVEELNRESQSHARIARGMLIPMPWSEKPLEKSSKGTILRGKAEERYVLEIEAAYNQTAMSNGDVSDGEIPYRVLEIVNSVMGNNSSERLEPETDLFAFGVDSIACVRIRQALSQLLPRDHKALPLTIVQDSGTISNLSQTILAIRQGRNPNVQNSEENMNQTMLDLVSEYSTFGPVQSTSQTNGINNHKPQKTTLLTGPTGSLGSHILSHLLTLPKTHIHLLLRGATPHAARERVLKALTSRKLPIPSDFSSKTTIHVFSLSKPLLGLPEETYNTLAREVDIVYHLAWSVDFVLPLKGFRQHFTGLRSLLNLQPRHFIFCSSTAALTTPSHPESVQTDPESCAGGIGYARSKWVAENILLSASKHFPEMRIDVVRAGQLSGDSKNGVWNMAEAIPLMLSSGRQVGCLPDLGGRMGMKWVPVDIAAKAFVELCRDKREGRGLGVMHVVNEKTRTSWREVCEWVCGVKEGVEIVEARVWLGRLGELRQSGSEHQCLKLFDFWKEAYGGEDGQGAVEEEYEMSRTFEAMPSVARMKPIDREYVLKLWAWIRENV